LFGFRPELEAGIPISVSAPNAVKVGSSARVDSLFGERITSHDSPWKGRQYRGNKLQAGVDIGELFNLKPGTYRIQ
jgi:hypothetical protein